MMKNSPYFSKLRVENLEERTLLAVMAGVIEQTIELVAPTEATTWIVNTWDDPTSWDSTDDTLSLREAIARAEFGDRISFESYLAGDTIYLNGNQLEVSKGLTIDASDIGGITINANWKSCVFYLRGSTETNPIRLIGLTITGGFLWEDYAAVCVYSDYTEITDCTFSENGCAIYNLLSNLTMTNCVVRNNYSDSRGVICNKYNSSSWLTMKDCIVSENNAGFIIRSDSRLVMTDCTISDNTTYNGVIYNEGYWMTMTNCTISGNRTENGQCGGIYNTSSDLTMTRCTVSGNVTNNGVCGGIYSDNASLTMIDCVIVGNTGGGICFNESRDYYALTLTNCTISGNSIGNSGYNGGIYINAENCSMSVTNCVIAYNNGGDINVDFFSSSSNVIGLDPGFVTAPIFDETGILINSEDIDLSLSRDSIAIDHGDNSVVASEIDIAGNSRVVATWRLTPTVDIGAYEYQETSVPSTITVTTAEDIVDETDNLISLREAVQSANDGDRIIFDDRLSGQTIILNNHECYDYDYDYFDYTSLLYVTRSIAIDASCIGGITIDARQRGRVFYVESSVNVELSGLTITGGDASSGGGIYNNSGTLTLTNCAITRNTSGYWGGGGIYNNCGTLIMLDCLVSENSTKYQWNINGGGGGIFSVGNLVMSNCTISGNDGDGIYIYDDPDHNNNTRMAMTNCTVSENSGDGIHISNPSDIFTQLSIINSVIVGNHGWGVYCNASTDYIYLFHDPTMTMTNCTIAGNRYGVWLEIYKLNLKNCIICCNWSSGFYDRTQYSDYSYYSRKNDNVIDSDPGFKTAPVFDETGILINFDSLDLSLSADSIAIDSGDNSVVTAETDIAGNPRIINSIVDIGAYEYQDPPTSATIVVTTVRDTINESDNLISLREAIQNANSGDIITFDSKLAGQTITLNGSELSITKNITIDASSIGGITINADGKSRVFYIRGGSKMNPSELKELTIKGGFSDEGGGIFNGQNSNLIMTDCIVFENTVDSDGNGGGIYNNGDLRMTNCAVIGNSAGDYDGSGGGIYNNGDLRMMNCTISGNYASDNFGEEYAGYGRYNANGGGGGIYHNTGTLIMSDCIIIENTAGGYYGNGGGIYNNSSSTSNSLTGCTISDNSASRFGGGIYNNHMYSSSRLLSLTNCTILRNFTDNDVGLSNGGGGIYNCGAEMLLNGCSVAGNFSSKGNGGGILNDTRNNSRSSLIIKHSLIFGNTAINGGGGGICSFGVYLTLENCDISGNSATGEGGGIAVNHSWGTYMTSCTISGNSASSYGGVGSFDVGVLVVVNTIITLNYANDENDIYYDQQSELENYVFDSNYLTGLDPGFVTAPIFDETGKLINLDNLDLSLLPESQIINIGNNAYVTTETDLAGNPRIYNGIVDLGAYEYQPELPTFSVSITDWSGSYDGSAHSITVNDPYADTDTIRYSTDGITYGLTQNPQYTNVGTYTTYVKVSRNGYQDWYGSAIVEITPAKIKDITLTGWTGNFDNTTHAIIVSDPYASTDTIRYSTDGKTYNLIDNPQYIDVGTYTTYVKVSRNSYQDWYGSAVVKITASVVTTLDDIVDSEDGFISLREAIASAFDGDSVSFSESLSDGTISLNGTQLEITKAITIDASGIGGIRIDGNGLNRAFYITGGTEESPVELIGLTISGGTVASGNGGGIYNTVALELRYCSVTGNSAGSGGGIYNSGQLTMFDCVVSDNTASSRGGGIFSSGSNSSLMMFGCTVAGNSSTSRGGGIFNSNGEMVLYNTIIALNTARIDADINNPNTDSIIEAYHCLSSFAGWATSLNCLEYDSGLPLFANPVIGDYSLAHNSQAIDRGSNTYVETETDLAGNMRVVNGIVDLGAYECQGTEPEQLAAPTITTGNMGIHVSYGANRHLILWDAIDNASGYELAYSADGNSWTTAAAEETSAVITGLAYGAVMEYRVRALGEGSYTDSDWSGTKSFVVCPVDVNNDGDISGADRAFMVDAWLSEEGGDRFVYYADINGDGDITGADRAFLVSNWLLNVEDDAEDLVYPPAKVSDAVFAEFTSADLAADLDVF